MNAVKTKFQMYGYDVDRYRYGSVSYLYPSFNGNAEYKCNKKGFRDLCSYLRSIRYFDILTKSIREEIFA